MSCECWFMSLLRNESLFLRGGLLDFELGLEFELELRRSFFQ